VARPQRHVGPTRFDFEAVVARQGPNRRGPLVPPILIGGAAALIVLLLGGSLLAANLLPVASISPGSGGITSAAPTPTLPRSSGSTPPGATTPSATTNASPAAAITQPPASGSGPTAAPTGKPIGATANPPTPVPTAKPTPKLTPKPTAPPVYAPGVSPGAFTGSCTTGLKAFGVTIDNTASTGQVDWVASFDKSAYPGNWGTAQPANGSVKAGGTIDVVVTPASDLCTSVKVKTTFTFTIAFAQANPVTVTFAVSP
jgi:hypothetical protein